MRKSKQPRVDIVFPKWKVRGHPTPNEKLMVCDGCGKAFWTTHGGYVSVRFDLCEQCNRLMREATPKEYKLGKAALKEII